MLHCTYYHRIIVLPFALEYLSYRDYASTAFAAIGVAIRQSNALASSRTQVRLNRHDLQDKNMQTILEATLHVEAHARDSM